MADTWLSIAVFLFGGFYLLAKGAGWLVDGGGSLARRLGVSTLVIGLTVVAWGTSAPEVVVSAQAAWEGKGGMSLGNVLGSNVANIGLVLGASATVMPAVLERRMRIRELFWFVASIALLWVLSLDRGISRVDAGVLLGVFAVYNVHLLVTARDTIEVHTPTMTVPRSVLLVVVGMVAITVGSKLVVIGAVAGAERFGMSDVVIGLTVLAIGTSLPELAAGLGSAMKGESDISVGNVVGSNVFNLIAVLGLVGLIRPLVPTDDTEDPLRGEFESALANDFPVVLGFSLATAVLPYLPGGGRMKGLTLLVGFATYLTVRVLGA